MSFAEVQFDQELAFYYEIKDEPQMKDEDDLKENLSFWNKFEKGTVGYA